MMRRSAKIYDKIYAAFGKDYAAEARTVRDLIVKHGQSSGKALLDVACGTGAHLARLREWFDVEGLDVDPEMLGVAAQRCPGVRLHQADMVDFKLPRAFDAVTCLFSSIGYVMPLERMRHAVANMAAHLVPGGTLVVEPWITPDAWRAGDFVDATFVDEPQLKIARINTTGREATTSLLFMHYLVGTPTGVEYFTERFQLGLYSHDEYAAALRDAGLETDFDPRGLIGRGLYVGVKSSS
jgi:SAM-dependent methyltransferase